jgi:hypothetical protein
MFLIMSEVVYKVDLNVWTESSIVKGNNRQTSRRNGRGD